MIESIILGAIQGIVEWLPISSEGVIVLVANNFLGISNLGEAVRLALFLHLGTFFAALVYFKKDVWRLTKTLFKYNTAQEDDKKLLVFIMAASLLSGILGYFLLGVAEDQSEFLAGKYLNILVAVLLFITAFLQFAAKTKTATKKQVQLKDGVLMGLLQGAAVLPGLSRSGLTVSGMLLRKYDEETALKASFLLSLPIVLGGNILLNADYLNLNLNNLAALLSSFVFGILTIHLLLLLAKKINFAYFVLIFAILVLIATFI